MRNRFDQLAKKIGRRALSDSGTTVAHDEINPETQYADLRHEPDLARTAERERLGLLGRFAACHCLIEVYSEAPEAADFRACLMKHFASWHQRVLATRKDKKRRRGARPPSVFVDSFLWIIAARVPITLLTKLKLEVAPDWPPGVYFFGDDVLRVGIVVATELPRERTTLLVRLMAAGPLLNDALDDIAALPATAHESAVAGPVLLELETSLRRKARRTPEEEAFIVKMQTPWDKARAEGRSEGRTEAQATAVLTVLEVRGIAVPTAARDYILAENDPEKLTRWHKKAIVASSIGEVIGEPS